MPIVLEIVMHALYRNEMFLNNILSLSDKIKLLFYRYAILGFMIVITRYRLSRVTKLCVFFHDLGDIDASISIIYAYKHCRIDI